MSAFTEATGAIPTAYRPHSLDTPGLASQSGSVNALQRRDQFLV